MVLGVPNLNENQAPWWSKEYGSEIREIDSYCSSIKLANITTILNVMLHQSSYSVLLPPSEENNGEMLMITENINLNTSIVLKQGTHAAVNNSDKDFTDE